MSVPGPLHDRGIIERFYLGNYVQLTYAIYAGLIVGQVGEFLMMLTIELAHWRQPMFGKTMLRTVQDRTNAAAPVMPADNDMFDLQCLDCELKHGHAVEVRGIDEIRNVTVHENFARL
jgi:hypothetical protein